MPARLEGFVTAAQELATHTRGEHVMFTMGSDFQYEDAEAWYRNLDKIIKASQADGRIHAFYSSPMQYVEAKRAEANAGTVQWPLDSGNNSDFFPYADGPHQFWTGYFTSRPALKRYVRDSSAFLNAMRQVQAMANVPLVDPLLSLEEAVAVAQHHDGTLM
jgi:alpha-mannosidase